MVAGCWFGGMLSWSQVVGLEACSHGRRLLVWRRALMVAGCWFGGMLFGVGGLLLALLLLVLVCVYMQMTGGGR